MSQIDWVYIIRDFPREDERYAIGKVLDQNRWVFAWGAQYPYQVGIDLEAPDRLSGTSGYSSHSSARSAFTEMEDAVVANVQIRDRAAEHVRDWEEYYLEHLEERGHRSDFIFLWSDGAVEKIEYILRIFCVDQQRRDRNCGNDEEVVLAEVERTKDREPPFTMKLSQYHIKLSQETSVAEVEQWAQEHGYDGAANMFKENIGELTELARREVEEVYDDHNDPRYFNRMELLEDIDQETDHWWLLFQQEFAPRGVPDLVENYWDSLRPILEQQEADEEALERKQERGKIKLSAREFGERFIEPVTIKLSSRPSTAAQYRFTYTDAQGGTKTRAFELADEADAKAAVNWLTQGGNQNVRYQEVTPEQGKKTREYIFQYRLHDPNGNLDDVTDLEEKSYFRRLSEPDNEGWRWVEERRKVAPEVVAETIEQIIKYWSGQGMIDVDSPRPVVAKPVRDRTKSDQPPFSQRRLQQIEEQRTHEQKKQQRVKQKQEVKQQRRETKQDIKEQIRNQRWADYYVDDDGNVYYRVQTADPQGIYLPYRIVPAKYGTSKADVIRLVQKIIDPGERIQAVVPIDWKSGKGWVETHQVPGKEGEEEDKQIALLQERLVQQLGGKETITQLKEKHPELWEKVQTQTLDDEDKKELQRIQRAQGKAVYDWTMDKLREKHPDWSYKQLLEGLEKEIGQVGSITEKPPLIIWRPFNIKEDKLEVVIPKGLPIQLRSRYPSNGYSLWQVEGQDFYFSLPSDYFGKQASIIRYAAELEEEGNATVGGGVPETEALAGHQVAPAQPEPFPFAQGTIVRAKDNLFHSGREGWVIGPGTEATIARIGKGDLGTVEKIEEGTGEGYIKFKETVMRGAPWHIFPADRAFKLLEPVAVGGKEPSGALEPDWVIQKRRKVKFRQAKVLNFSARDKTIMLKMQPGLEVLPIRRIEQLVLVQATLAQGGSFYFTVPATYFTGGPRAGEKQASEIVLELVKEGIKLSVDWRPRHHSIVVNTRSFALDANSRPIDPRRGQVGIGEEQAREVDMRDKQTWFFQRGLEWYVVIPPGDVPGSEKYVGLFKHHGIVDCLAIHAEFEKYFASADDHREREIKLSSQSMTDEEPQVGEIYSTYGKRGRSALVCSIWHGGSLDDVVYLTFPNRAKATWNLSWLKKNPYPEYDTVEGELYSYEDLMEDTASWKEWAKETGGVLESCSISEFAEKYIQPSLRFSLSSSTMSDDEWQSYYDKLQNGSWDNALKTIEELLPRDKPHRLQPHHKEQLDNFMLNFHENIKDNQKELSLQYSEEPPSQCSGTFWLYASNKNGDYPQPTKNSGKWVIWVYKEDMDEAWSKLKKSVEQGKLGQDIKIKTKQYEPDDWVKVPIIIYTYDWQDGEDVWRIRNELKRLGFDEPLHYKTDENTLRNDPSSKYKEKSQE